MQHVYKLSVLLGFFFLVSLLMMDHVVYAGDLQEERANYSFSESSVGEVFQQLGRQNAIDFQIYGNERLLIKRRTFEDATVEEVIQGVLPVGSAIVWEYRYGKLSAVEVSIFEKGRMRGKVVDEGGAEEFKDDKGKPVVEPPPPVMFSPPSGDPAFRFRTEVYEGRGHSVDSEVFPGGGGEEGSGQDVIVPPPVVPIP